MKDLTKKYINMIERFENDFDYASNLDIPFTLNEIQKQLNEKSNKILENDIDLLKEMSYNLRHGKIKILGEE